MGAAETQTEITQAKLDELERQTEMLEEQVKKQTKLLLEQSILESDAYREGFNLENLAESDGDFDPVTSNRHRVNIMFDYGGKVYIENAVPGFITPRLRDAYLIGLRDRLKQDFPSQLSSIYWSALSFWLVKIEPRLRRKNYPVVLSSRPIDLSLAPIDS